MRQLHGRDFFHTGLRIGFLIVYCRGIYSWTKRDFYSRILLLQNSEGRNFSFTRSLLEMGRIFMFRYLEKGSPPLKSSQTHPYPYKKWPVTNMLGCTIDVYNLHTGDSGFSKFLQHQL